MNEQIMYVHHERKTVKLHCDASISPLYEKTHNPHVFSVVVFDYKRIVSVLISFRKPKYKSKSTH